MISIVIPLYNKESQIAKTLKAVLGQTFQDYEIIIINDGSTDNSVGEVKNFHDPRIRLINQDNAGVSAARNRGIQESKGRYVAFLDADDEWMPDYLENIHQLILKYSRCNVFACRYIFSDEYNNQIQTSISGINLKCGESGELTDYFHIASVSDAPLWTSVVVASRQSLLDIGGFPEGITSGEDLLTWARLACRNRIAFLNKVCAIYYTPTTGPTGKVPADLESTNDAVGTALCELNEQYPDKGVDEYVSFWYKMRGVINLRRFNRLAALRCAVKSIRYRPANLKSWAVMGLAFMPAVIIKKVFTK